MREWLSIYLKGVFMGMAEGVPGVSGGTIALITGIYERLVGAIAAFEPSVLADLPRAYDPDARGRIAGMLREMDVAFLAVLLAGMFSAIVAVTGAILSLKESSPAVLYAFFFGLIAASAVVLWTEVRLDTNAERVAAIVGFLLAFALAGVSTGPSVPHSPVVLFVAGGLAVSAMVLPGVSGAFLLLLFGQYDFMSNALHEFLDRVAAVGRGGSPESALGPAVAVVSFVAGATVGVLTFARIVEWALSNHREVTLTFLVALMVGALRLPVVEVVAADGAWPLARAVAVLTAGLVGAAAVLLIDYYTDDLEYVEDAPSPTSVARND